MKELLNSEYGQAVECFEFIKKYNQVNVESILKKLKINKSNFYNFRCKKSTYMKVKRYIESEIAKLYIIEDDSNEEN